MQVTSTSTASSNETVSPTSSQASKNSTSTNYDAFLQLLVTEVRNQDPTKPMDPTQTVTQLATFSQVEQAVQSNAKLDSILSVSMLSQAGSLIGKTVTLPDGSASGKVASVTTSATGLTATLANGAVIDLVQGITVS